MFAAISLALIISGVADNEVINELGVSVSEQMTYNVSSWRHWRIRHLQQATIVHERLSNRSGATVRVHIYTYGSMYAYNILPILSDFVNISYITYAWQRNM